ncbi:MAG: polyprenol monophosphomannose synthase [Planctomycetaceae bacterium]|nr:polyprenol monophosphomannose synthase [Planctomycetaceae bacterium]
MSETTLLVSLCTYNEAENLPLLVPRILDTVPQAHVLVVDDNSPDGTGRIADEMAAKDPRVKVLHRTGKLGLGTATLAAFQFAADQGYEFVLNLDADFSHPPETIPELLKLASDADVVIGSRYVPGGKIEGWGLKRHFMSRGVNFYSRLLLRLPTRDCSGAFRCYRVSLLRKLDWSKIRGKGYAFQEEILYRCRRVGGRFKETPIQFVDRRYGSSKINMREAMIAMWVILRLGIENLRGVPV